ncbi:MAG: flagellar export chaperone FliS [Oscillospiraceae bacterium]
MAMNPYKKYQEQSVATMTQGEMLNLLYETCSKRLNAGVMYIEEKRYDLANENLQKAQRIITYLNNTLDRKYEISQNLSSLYDYFNEQIIKGNIHKDTAVIKEIIPMIDDLGKTFKQAEKLARQQNA